LLIENQTAMLVQLTITALSAYIPTKFRGLFGVNFDLRLI